MLTPSDKLLSLIQSPNTVTSELAKDTSRSVFEVAHDLYGSTEPSKIHKILDKLHLGSSKSDPEKVEQVEFTKEVLDRVAEGGKFKERPTDLFSKVSSTSFFPLAVPPSKGGLYLSWVTGRVSRCPPCSDALC